MTTDSILLSRRMVLRVLVFIVTLIIGIGLGQIFSFNRIASVEVSPVQKTRRCPHALE
jgi:hypothetical protein